MQPPERPMHCPRRPAERTEIIEDRSLNTHFGIRAKPRSSRCVVLLLRGVHQAQYAGAVYVVEVTDGGTFGGHAGGHPANHRQVVHHQFTSRMCYRRLFDFELQSRNRYFCHFATNRPEPIVRS